MNVAELCNQLTPPDPNEVVPHRPRRKTMPLQAVTLAPPRSDTPGFIFAAYSERERIREYRRQCEEDDSPVIVVMPAFDRPGGAFDVALDASHVRRPLKDGLFKDFKRSVKQVGGRIVEDEERLLVARVPACDGPYPEELAFTLAGPLAATFRRELGATPAE